MQHQNNVNTALPTLRFEMLTKVKNYLTYIYQANVKIHDLFRLIGDLSGLKSKKQSFKELLIQASADVETSINNTGFMQRDTINKANVIQKEIIIHEDFLIKLETLVNDLLDIGHFIRNCTQESVKITEASVLKELTTLKNHVIYLMNIIFDHAKKNPEIYRYIPNIAGLQPMIVFLSQTTFVLATNEKPTQQVDTAKIVNELTKRYNIAPIKASEWASRVQNNQQPKVQNNHQQRQTPTPQTLPLHFSDPAQNNKFFTGMGSNISTKRACPISPEEPCPISPEEPPHKKQSVTEIENRIENPIDDLDPYWNQFDQLEQSLNSLPKDNLDLGGDDGFYPTM